MTTRSKHRICRRVGAPVCGRPNCPALDRPYPPGQHGRRRQRGPTEYQIRLLEKQKLKAMYGMRERQFRRLFDRATRMEGPTGRNLLILIERRLDNLVRRLGFAVTIQQARQLVSHGHIDLDGHRVDRPSLLVSPGQEISLRENLSHVRHAMHQSPEVPSYLERDEQRLSGRLVRLPQPDEIPHPVPVDDRLVVEFYAA